MSRFRIQIRENRLPRLAEQTRRRLRERLQAIAEDVERDAKARAPVDTGELRDSIHVEVEPGEPLAFNVAADAAHAAFVEFGTRHMAAQPYLSPALEAARPDVAWALRKAVEEAASE